MTAAERDQDSREEAECFGRIYLARWLLVVRPLVGVRFEDPETDHAKRGRDLTLRVDEESRRRNDGFPPTKLPAVIMAHGRLAAALRAERAAGCRAMRANAWRRLSTR